MNLQFFCCFHHTVIHEIYKISPREKEKYITFYGVKRKDPSVKKVMYESELPHYNPSLQKQQYNEGSCLYHVYMNQLHDAYDYVGFCQYDMTFSKNVFHSIEKRLSANTIFYLSMFQWGFLGGQTAMIQDYPDIPSGLRSYNQFFNTHYTKDHLIPNQMITCNTFLIPRKMYGKMMSWLLPYFKDIQRIHHCEKGEPFDPGHMIEALTSLFLFLEKKQGAVYEHLELEHHAEFKHH